MRTLDEVRDLQSLRFQTSTETAISSLPPNYVDGFKFTISKDYEVTIGGGLTTVQGTRVEHESRMLREVDWDCDKVASTLGTFFYVYLTRTDQYKVSRVKPSYSSRYFYYAHDVYGWRAIGKVWLDTDNKIKWCSSEFRTYQNRVYLATSDYLGDADYYVGEDEDSGVYANMATRYLYLAYGGGVAQFSSEEFTFETSITAYTRVQYHGEGWQTHLTTNTVSIFDVDYDYVLVYNMRITYGGADETETYLIDADGNNFQGQNLTIDHPGCLGVSLGGNRCKLVQNDFTGGKKSDGIAPAAATVINSAGGAQYPSVVNLDETHFVVAYGDENNSDYPTCKVGTIASDGTITLGSAQVVATSGSAIPVIALVDTNKIIVAYTDTGDGNKGKAAVGTVNTSTSTISFGSVSDYVGNVALRIGLCVMSPSVVVSTFMSGVGGSGGSIGLGISGTTITPNGGGVVEFNSGATITTRRNVAKINSTDFIVAYEDDGNSDYGTVRVGTISGTAISYSGGSETVFLESAVVDVCIKIIDESKAVICYAKDAATDYLYARIANIDGKTVTFEDEVLVDSRGITSGTAGTNIGYINASKAFVAYIIGSHVYVRILTDYGKYLDISDDIYVDAGYTIAYSDVSQNVLVYGHAVNGGGAVYLDISAPESYCIKADGNNNIIGNNTIHGSTGKFIEVGIDSDGDLNTIANNTIEGDGQNREYILHGINIRDDSNNNNVSSNNISGVEKVAVVMQGSNNKVSNIMAKDNGNLIDRGDCQSETAPMVEGETTPNTANCTASRSSAEAYEGTYSWKLNKDSAAASGNMNFDFTDSQDDADMHGLVAGLTYKLTFRVYIDSTNGPQASEVSTILRDYYSGSWNNTTITATTQDAWELMELEFTLDDDSTGVVLRVQIDSAADQDEYIYIDHVRLEPVGTHNEHEQSFVDYGTGTQKNGNSWQGGV